MGGSYEMIQAGSCSKSIQKSLALGTDRKHTNKKSHTQSSHEPLQPFCGHLRWFCYCCCFEIVWTAHPSSKRGLYNSNIHNENLTTRRYRIEMRRRIRSEAYASVAAKLQSVIAVTFHDFVSLCTRTTYARMYTSKWVRHISQMQRKSRLGSSCTRKFSLLCGNGYEAQVGVLSISNNDVKVLLHCSNVCKHMSHMPRDRKETTKKCMHNFKHVEHVFEMDCDGSKERTTESTTAGNGFQCI